MILHARLTEGAAYYVRGAHSVGCGGGSKKGKFSQMMRKFNAKKIKDKTTWTQLLLM